MNIATAKLLRRHQRKQRYCLRELATVGARGAAIVLRMHTRAAEIKALAAAENRENLTAAEQTEIDGLRAELAQANEQVLRIQAIVKGEMPNTAKLKAELER